MKKILFILPIIFLTLSCSNETLQGYLTVECTKTDNFNNTINTNIISIKHKDNVISNIKYSYKYETEDLYALDSYKQSLISESNKYKNEFINITNKEENNSFEIIYDIDVSKIDDELKEELDLEELSSNQVKKLEKEGYSCGR